MASTGRENQHPQPQSGNTAAKRANGATDGLLSPPKKQCRTDPLVGYGKHFGRTIRTFCHVQTIITHGLSRTMQLELDRISEEELTPAACVCNGQITKGISGAKSDDTKSLKSAVIDWITPTNGVLSPPIPRNVKAGRGYHHDRTGSLLCPVNLNWEDPKIRRELAAGTFVPTADLWPRFIYRGYEYDSRDPWSGLLRSALLVKAFKHVFTSPSSVDAPAGIVSSTRLSNARIHGMTAVTAASIAYIATQVRFALLASNVFSQTDKVTDSEGFYNHLIDLLEDEEEQEEVASLLKWWNQQIFPAVLGRNRDVHSDSVIAKVKERRRLIKDGLWNPQSGAVVEDIGTTPAPTP